MWNVFRLFGVLDQEFQHFMRKQKNDIFGRILDVQKGFIKISKSLWTKFRGTQVHDFSISCSDFSISSFGQFQGVIFGPLTGLPATFNHFWARWTTRNLANFVKFGGPFSDLMIQSYFLIGWHNRWASCMVRLRVRFSCVRSRYVLEIEQVLRCGFVMRVKSLQRFYFIKTYFVTL